MAYPIIQSPSTLLFREMPKSELVDYFAWFMNVMPGRIKALEDAVHGTSGFEAWRPDYSSDSLDSLGEWFAGQVATRERTPEEVVEAEAKMTMGFPIAGRELTNRTYSLAMDIGMYLGEVMRRTHPSLRWGQYLKNKRDADYGQVSIEGTGVVSMNVVRFMVAIAQQIADKSETGHRIRKIYDIWAGPESGLFVSSSTKNKAR